MATRREIQQNRIQLREALLEACHDGKLQPHQALPPMRHLARQHGLSVAIVCEVVQALVREGVLYSRQGAGTFVGLPPQERIEPFLFVRYPLQEVPIRAQQVQNGFEDRIAQLGGTCLTLGREEAAWHRDQGDLPPLSGIFDGNTGLGSGRFEMEGVPCAAFGPSTPGEALDRIQFDDAGGGEIATRHLLALGHRDIAFLGLHGQSGEAGIFVWSQAREAGWRRAMAGAGRPSAHLSFLPPVSVPFEAHFQREEARQVAASLLLQPEVTAVVAANRHAAEGLLLALREANVATAKWPAIVCFDEAAEGSSSVISYLRLPWDEVGQLAAQGLWERTSGRITGPPQARLVAMRLVPRLSCRPRWAEASGLASGQARGLGFQPSGPSRQEDALAPRLSYLGGIV